MGPLAVQPAFRDPARDAQAVFRAVMDAMARPGSVQIIAPAFTPPPPLGPVAAAIALALADYETPIWLDAALARGAEIGAFLRFHTGAKLVASPEEASFALIAEPRAAPPLSAFARGTPDYPDRSTTVILQVNELTKDGWRLAGPGIAGETGFGAAPLPEDFAQQLHDNRARFPLGVDVIFAAQAAVAALPRSIRILEAR